MVFLCGLAHELPKPKDVLPKPLRFVTCVTRHPCACCGFAFVLAVLTSFAGMRILIDNSGPLGPFKTGLDYPYLELIARNADALDIARERSALALLGSQTSTSSAGGRPFGRRLGGEESRSVIEIGTDVAGDLVKKLDMASSDQRRRLDATQEQQSVTLATALLIVGAREGVTNVYDDAGVTQLCNFRAGLMNDEPTFVDYCLLEYPGNGNGTRTCNRGTDGLALFFGDASYDIDTIDVADFATPNFDEIVTAVIRRESMTLASYPPADVAKVRALYFKLFGYVVGAWQDSTQVCDMSKKKDLNAVLNVLAHVREAPSLESFDGILNQYFDMEFSVANPVTKYTKGFYNYGAPLSGFTNYIENTAVADQDVQYQQWWTASRFRSLYPEGVSTLWPTMQPTVLNTKLLLSEILLILLGDGLRAIAPVILVTLIVWLQTGSLFIAVITITEIIFSLTCAIFVTSGVLQIKWVSFQCALALYVVLAIGADDVFVFMDAYKQSFYKGADVNQTLEHRMSWVYRRAGLAMLITSLTTCSSFVASALSSPIPELQNFGIFAAFVILIDYALVMSFLCANCILFHNYFEMKPGLCCACCDGCCATWKCAKGGCSALCTFSGITRSTEVAQAGEVDEGTKSCAVRFFETTFPFDLVVKRTSTRVASMLVFLALLGAAIASAVRIEPQTSSENFLPEDNPFQRYQTLQSQFAPSNFDSTVEIHFVWGFEANDPLDQTGVNLIFDADFKGTPKYQTGFELTPAAQTALLQACDVLAAANATKIEIDTDSGNTAVQTQCFMHRFRRYVQYTGASFPLPTAAEAARVLEAWVLDDSVAVPADALAGEYRNDVGWRKDSDDVLILSYLQLRAFSKLGTRSFLSSSQTRVYYNEWQSVLAQVNAITSPTALSTAFQLSGLSTGISNKWVYMMVQEAYVRMALTGALASLVIATIVLLLATRNLIVTFTSIGTILAALVCVFGTIVAMGWQLGSNESLCVMVLPGFAVDYVVHLSHAYMESHSQSRVDRVKDALRDLGISVFWGMLTSILAATALAGCSIQTLSKFGVFFALTIAYSYLWSVLFLMPLLATIGPQPPCESSAVKPTQKA